MRICCIVKPDAVRHIDGILRLFDLAGLPVLERRDITYTTALVHQLYDHMPDDAREAIAGLLAGKPGIALLIESPDLDAVLDLAGRESDPGLCALGTIRCWYGNRRQLAVGSWPWWENAIHRPVDMRETERDLELIFGNQ